MADEGEENWSTLSSVTLQKFVNKRVSILLSNSSKKVGWVHTIDPVTRTVILEEENEGTGNGHGRKLTFVLGHAISRVVLTNDIDSSEGPRHRITDFIAAEKTIDYSEDELAKRKGELIEWLTRNRVPVKECSENNAVLSVMGVLFVEPPYGPECCRCSNEIILDRIQKLIRTKQDHEK